MGLAAAWWLQRRGHRVVLLDPNPWGDGAGLERSGSGAALGVLMGDVFHRDRGRGWRLRRQALQLWPSWRRELARAGWTIPSRSGLLLLASDAAEAERQTQLAERRRSQGLPLEIWPRERLATLRPELPAAPAGLFSGRDGQLDPLAALAAFRGDGVQGGLLIQAERAIALERSRHWRVLLQGGSSHEAEAVVLANGCGMMSLLAPLGHQLPLEPVLGQAAELALAEQHSAFETWPAAVIWRGINLVPRPGRRLWIGATLEPGRQAAAAALEELLSLQGQAPAWLQHATLLQHWQGLRPRPLGQPAPLLLEPEPDLLVVGGTYRNGVLLAPALAQWCAEQLEKP